MSPRLESQEEAAARLAAERLSAHEQSALWRRLEASVEAAPSRRRRRLALAISAPGLAVAVVLLGVWWVRDTREAREASQRRAIAASCALDPSAPQLRLPADCAARSLTVDGDEWSLSAGAEVARVDNGARVVRGRVGFHVRPRTAQTQFRVRVSHGEVRVVGTVFQVEQLTDRGSIAVTQGVIEFVWEDGTRERVAAGQTLHWPRPTPAPSVLPEPTHEVTPAPPVGPDRRAPSKPATHAAVDMEHTLDRLLQLQSQKRFDEAVVLLRETLQQPGLTPVQRKRLRDELERISTRAPR